MRPRPARERSWVHSHRRLPFPGVRRRSRSARWLAVDPAARLLVVPRPVGDAAQTVLGPYVGDARRLLDVGSADGPSVGWLTAPHKVSLDLDPRGLRPPSGVCGSLLALPFADASFEVVERLRRDRALRARAGRAPRAPPGARAGGRLLVSVPAYQWAWSDHDVANGHHRRYTRARAVAALEAAGFDVRRATYGFAGVFPMFVAERAVARRARPCRRAVRRGRPTSSTSPRSGPPPSACSSVCAGGTSGCSRTGTCRSARRCSWRRSGRDPPSAGRGGVDGRRGAHGRRRAGGAPAPRRPRYFWHGDTPAAYYGWWYHLGEMVRHGQWTHHRPAHLAGGQPRRRGPVGAVEPADRSGIGLLATVVAERAGAGDRASSWRWRSARSASSALVRSYDAPPAAAYVAAVAVPMGGMTQYLDLPSWVAGRDDLGAAALGVVGAAAHDVARSQPARRRWCSATCWSPSATSTARSC